MEMEGWRGSAELGERMERETVKERERERRERKRINSKVKYIVI